ncbi:MAG: 50S ribosomal protein L3 [Candidatus Koribacter versatilis]|uniref:Large ribosomal subunit protein uL3 n=1 Tax=Candidatus Korobacter versatilis TaxID=658062 RepID=A0A932EQH9_9BACT|nr:50S ribosomal protein L3 [Candidatus Koribacter versatilis]
MASVNGILGKKVGMTQLFDDRGDVRPVTVLQAGPCVITQKKSAAKDGYDAVQIGLVEFVKGKNVSKPMQGHFAKHNLPPVKFMKEVSIISETAKSAAEGHEDVAVKVGDKVLVDIFQDERFVDVSGTSKGRGFAGVVRRHHFQGGPAAHGHMFQVQGSIGASSFPSRVFPNQRMSGHMGDAAVTVRNLKIRGIDVEENLLFVEGAVPGHKGAYVVITRAKQPPRERRGFAGSTTIDPLKAAKKAAAGKAKK